KERERDREGDLEGLLAINWGVVRRKKKEELRVKIKAPEATKRLEPRSKSKHDVNVLKESDEPLSEFVKKEKRDVKVADKPAQKKMKEEKNRETSTRGVDPSVAKQKENEGEILPKLPGELIEGRNAIGGKILDKSWLVANDLNNLVEMLKTQGWEKLFVKRDLVYKSSRREFYKDLVIKMFSKKEMVCAKVRGVYIEFDEMSLAFILGIPGNTGICKYLKGF
ncbi:hypothetical protein Dimus_030273, partial [Dionaea muscipula]